MNNNTKVFETNVPQKNDFIHTIPVVDINWSNGDGKFVNTLSTKSAKSPSASVEVQQLLKKWREQTDFLFGFVQIWG